MGKSRIFFAISSTK